MPSDADMEARVAALLVDSWGDDDRTTYQVLRDAGLTVVESDRLALAEAVVEAARDLIANTVVGGMDVSDDLRKAIAAHDSGAVSEKQAAELDRLDGRVK